MTIDTWFWLTFVHLKSGYLWKSCVLGMFVVVVVVLEWDKKEPTYLHLKLSNNLDEQKILK